MAKAKDKTTALKKNSRKLSEIRRLARCLQKEAVEAGKKMAYQQALEIAAKRHNFSSWWHATEADKVSTSPPIDLAEMKASLAKAAQLIRSDAVKIDGDGIKVLALCSLPKTSNEEFREIADFISSLDELLSLEQYQLYNEKTDRLEVHHDRALMYYTPREFDIFIVKGWKKYGIRQRAVKRTQDPGEWSLDNLEVPGVGSLRLRKDFFYSLAEAEGEVGKIVQREKKRIERFEKRLGGRVG